MRERIDEKRKAQSEISELKAQLEEAKAVTDFMQCDAIQKKIDELKVNLSVNPFGRTAHTHKRWCPSVTTPWLTPL